MSACRSAYTKCAQTLSLGNPYSNPSRSLIPPTVTAASTDPISSTAKASDAGPDFRQFQPPASLTLVQWAQISNSRLLTTNITKPVSAT